MNLKSLLFVAAVLLSLSATAQTSGNVSGTVQDTTGNPVFSATIKLFPSTGKGDTLMTRSDVDGNFTFRDVKYRDFNIRISSLGYTATTVKSPAAPVTFPLRLPTIVIKADSRVLQEVVVDGTPPVAMKTDTVEYSVANLNLKPDATVEDALKRVDGAEVDKDGNVTNNGKPVTRIKVDGKEIFGGDLKTITRNLPADAIDKIQMVDDYGDQAKFTGVKDGEPEPIINITTKPGRNRGLLANGTIGGGTEDRYQLGLFATEFQGDRNLGITANLNNNNTQIGGGGFGGRMGARGGFMPGANQGGSGITNLGSLGLSYNNKFGANIKISASYYFNNSDRSLISDVYRQSANLAGTLYSQEFSNSNNVVTSHSFSGRMEYEINKRNQLIVTPFITFGKSTNTSSGSTFQTGFQNQDQTSTNISTSLSPNFNTGILYNHLFAKAGRNYSINLNMRNSLLDADQDNDNHIVYYDLSGNTLLDSINHRINATENRTFSGSGRLVYNEPLSEKSRIQLSYNLNYNNYDNSRITSLNDLTGVPQVIDSLSNIFEYSFVSQRFGINYNYRDKNHDLAIGITGNPTHLSGESATLNTVISRNNFFFAPIARYQYRFSGTRTLSINYSGSASEPQFAQLQPVRDVSNPQRPVVGNPDLNSSFAHSIDANYRTSNPEKRNSLMLTFQGSTIANQIVQNVVLIPDILGSRKQEIRYLNTNGYFTYFTGYNWQQSFADKQFVLTLRGDTRLTRNVSFADNVKNYATRRNVSQRINILFNPGDWMELNPGLMYGITTTKYSLETNTDIKLNTYNFNLDGRIFFTKARNLIWGFNGGKTFNDGYTGGLNTNPLVVNSYIEKKFLKNNMAYVRLQAFDLFGQANNITRTVVENGFTDSNTNRLTQYFMLTLNMRINKLAGGRPSGSQNPGFNRPDGAGFGRN